MKFTLVGKLIDVGDMEGGGRGFAIQVGDRVITVSGLAVHEVRYVAAHFSKNIAVGFEAGAADSAGDSHG